MENLVIYASKRGSTKIYAQTFVKEHHYPIADYRKVSTEQLVAADRIIYFGSVYAGKVTGLAALKKKLNKKLPIVVISVGLTSKKDYDLLAAIQKGILTEFPEAMTFHLRGALTQAQLNIAEKMLLKMLSKTNKTQSEEVSEMVLAIRKVVAEGSVDYFDLANLTEIQL
ncbi:menaquinone-dependent protoporphyrinogen IX oxidase [Enterococcus sp. PF1-24]|uniref:flavodoxin domain-containing protein n=1 Tax=unclassified Enterococcus TaxID=2608891 RepID=UPI0024745FAC|nr:MULTISPECIES: flavodoxin domain-containing protein [unclassified Enterococcus]MDH6365327.1 menaquinone-dependent protoporphyrinogen IX oxidase [Enterococcus sp. PFB1-1]MDH6402417.1 menaquinone-dependent protoporphyrinogen IX oxidase [Enterococcus sp. PF1-24]